MVSEEGCSKAVLHRLGKQDDYNNHTVKDVKCIGWMDVAASDEPLLFRLLAVEIFLTLTYVKMHIY